jgi:hypothetical protein
MTSFFRGLFAKSGYIFVRFDTPGEVIHGHNERFQFSDTVELREVINQVKMFLRVRGRDIIIPRCTLEHANFGSVELGGVRAAHVSLRTLKDLGFTLGARQIIMTCRLTVREAPLDTRQVQPGGHHQDFQPRGPDPDDNTQVPLTQPDKVPQPAPHDDAADADLARAQLESIFEQPDPWEGETLRPASAHFFCLANNACIRTCLLLALDFSARCLL